MRAIWLIGMMGSGKTTVGALIAGRTGVPFIDTDADIETECGRTIGSIWETEGEPTFRDLETEHLNRIVTAGRDCVVATGGGVVLRAGNVAVMRNNGLVVWLTAGHAELVARLRNTRTRPLLVDQQTDGRVAELLAERSTAYADAAHFMVDTSDKNPEEVAQEVILLWNAS